MLERRRDPLRNERITRRRDDIAARLRPVCPDFPEAEFDALVTRAAEIDVKYTMRTGLDAFRNSIASQLVQPVEPKPDV